MTPQPPSRNSARHCSLGCRSRDTCVELPYFLHTDNHPLILLVGYISWTCTPWACISQDSTSTSTPSPRGQLLTRQVINDPIRLREGAAALCSTSCRVLVLVLPGPLPPPGFGDLLLHSSAHLLPFTNNKGNSYLPHRHRVHRALGLPEMRHHSTRTTTCGCGRGRIGARARTSVGLGEREQGQGEGGGGGARQQQGTKVLLTVLPQSAARHCVNVFEESKATNPPGVQCECWECGNLVRTLVLVVIPSPNKSHSATSATPAASASASPAAFPFRATHINAGTTISTVLLVSSMLLRNKAVGASTSSTIDESIEIPMELVKLITVDSVLLVVVACVKPKL